MADRKLRRRRFAALTALILTLPLVALLVFGFPWNLLREPINRYVTEKTGRAFAINGDLQVHLGRVTDVSLHHVRFANPDWSDIQPMVAADTIRFSVELLPLLHGRVVLTRLDLEGAQAVLERNADGQANWALTRHAKPSEPTTAPDIRQLSIRDSTIRYRDPAYGADVHARVDTNAKATLPMHIAVRGRYKDIPISGTADTGSVLTLQDSAQPFPAKIEAHIDQSTVRIDGALSDLIKGGTIDAKLSLAGPSLSELYPVVPVVLPRTPPYKISGEFKRSGDAFHYDDFEGRIGGSDIRGDAGYTVGDPPMLKAALESRRLDLADLGPLAGLSSKPKKNDGSDGSVDDAAAANTSAFSSAPASAPPADGANNAPDSTPRKVLPHKPFRLERLNAMNADVTLKAGHLLRPDAVALEDMRVHLLLENGVLKLQPLEFGFSGGKIAADLVLDGSQDPIRSQAKIDLRNVKLQQLLPDSEMMRASAGTIGARIRMHSSGNSVAAMLGNADGEAGLAMAGGELSGLLLEAVNLNGSGILKYLAFGDKSLPNRCSVADFDIKDGVAVSRSMVFDTAVSNIQGSGQIDFRQERLDLRLDPKPKEKSILVARTPIHIRGPFSGPDYSLEKGPLLARGGLAVGLGLINPVAALLALIEPGPGTDANCKKLLASVSDAQRQSERSGKPAPLTEPKLEPLKPPPQAPAQ